MFNTQFILLFTTLLELQGVLGQSSQCESNSNIGTNDETPYNHSTTAGLYLNLNSSAECNGTISSYRYCYYQPVAATRHAAVVAVYRLNQMDNIYELVVGSEHTIDLDLRVTTSTDPLVCDNVNLTIPAQLQTGDVVGACIFDDSSNREQLDLVGQSANGSTLYSASNSGCTRNNPPPDVSIQDLSPPLTSTILHLSAIITSTTDPPPTTVGTTGGSTNTQPTGNSTTDGGAGAPDNTGGVVAGIMVALIVVIIAVVVVVIVVVIVLRKRQGKTLFYSVTKTGTFGANSKQVGGFDNQVYSTGEFNRSLVGDVTLNPDPQSYESLGENTTSMELTESNPYEIPYTLDRNGANQVVSSSTMSGSTKQSASPRGNPIPAPYEGMSFGGNVYCSPLDASVVQYSKLIEQNIEEDIYSNVDPFQKPGSHEEEIYLQLKTWGILNLSQSDVEVVSHLGSGQFGSVEQGLWKRHGTKPVDVALKSLNKKSPEEDKVKFLQEAAIMGQFRHPNVIMLYGVVSKGDPMILVVELAQKGDLRQYLLSMRPDPGELVPSETPKTFMKFSQHVALGMQYLSGKGFVHRDLAARNILVSKNNVCKVADFGMSRDLEDESYYVSQGGKIPVKWTAPEAIHYKKYSTASDVWAYGCLLYEIWSVGYKPFEGKRNMEVIGIVDDGERLAPPPGCPRMVYELMILCWHPETALRPGFRDVVLTLVGSEQMVLNIPEEDSSSNPLAGVLGAPLEAGENMYTSIQKRYIDYVAKKETDEDYFEID